MSGDISFPGGVFWGKAGWCYRAALDGICSALREMPEGQVLADELSAESHPAQWCQFLDLKDWPKEKKKLLSVAIQRCLDRNRTDGPVGWHDPSFFPGFLQALEELIVVARDAAKDE